MVEPLYTIGHSTHSTKRLTQLLRAHEVTAVADVRSHPYSRVNPQFNRESLRAELKAARITYVFLGRELGARTEDKACYIDGKVQYDLLARTPLFRKGLARIVHGMGSHRIALMCAERDPLTCHRAILVCRHLAAQGKKAQHILAQGQLESHEDAITRLLGELGIAENELFRSRDDLITEAYSRRGQQIAYSEKQPLPEANVGVVDR